MSAGLAAQDVRQVTTKAEVHRDARLSPDGQTVAFVGPNKIGVVAYSGGNEGSLVTGSNLSDFRWSAKSTGIYFLDGADLKFVPRTGGNAQKLVTVAGTGVRVWAVDQNDTWVYGTRLTVDPKNPNKRNYHVWRVASTGASQVTDVVTRLGPINEVAIDPTGNRIAWLEGSSAPFAPAEILAADAADGKNQVSMSGQPLQSSPSRLTWLDKTSLVFQQVSPANTTFQIARIDTPGTVYALTETLFGLVRNPVLSDDGTWIVCEVSGPRGPVPGFVPVDGGGVVYVERSAGYLISSGPDTGGGGRVVFTGKPTGSSILDQVFAVDLDREVRISPKLEITKTSTIAMKAGATEPAAILLAVQLSPSGEIQLPGFARGLMMDPVGMVVAVSGLGGSAGELKLSLAVPNNPWLQGQVLFWQGVHLGATTRGFTRHVSTWIF